MTPSETPQADELVLNVTNLHFAGKRMINPPASVAVFSRSQQEFKQATAGMYHESGGEQLITVEYVDGSGTKSLTVTELQQEIGKTVRIVFDPKNYFPEH